MNWLSYIFLGIAFAATTGCATDRRFAPPASSEQVNVTIKVSKILSVLPIKAVYTSSVCKRTTFDSHGRSMKVDGFDGFTIFPVKTDVDGVYEAKVPMNGGGGCGWKLSNITFGVVYSDLSLFGEDAVFGTGGSGVVMFDNNSSWRGGPDFVYDGDLHIFKDYYPWIGEATLGGYRKQVSLAGEGDIYFMYRALQARNIYFEPILHSRFEVLSVAPKTHKKGTFTTFTYPDGTTESNGRWRPNFHKLQAIRLKAAADAN